MKWFAYISGGAILCLILNLPVGLATFRARNYPRSLRYLLTSNSVAINGSVLMQIVKASRIVIAHHQLGETWMLSTTTNFLIDLPGYVFLNATLFTFVSVVIERYQTTSRLETNQRLTSKEIEAKNRNSIYLLIAAPWFFSAALPVTIYVISMPLLSCRQATFLSVADYYASPYDTVHLITLFLLELCIPIIYVYVMRWNAVLMRLFNIDGYHQSLQSRVMLRHTAEVSKAMAASVLVHVSSWMGIVIPATIVTQFLSVQGQRIFYGWVQNLFFVFFAAHPLLVVCQMVNVRTQLGKILPVLTPILDRIHRRHQKYDQRAFDAPDGTNMVESNAYFIELNDQWTRSYQVIQKDAKQNVHRLPSQTVVPKQLDVQTLTVAKVDDEIITTDM